MTKQATTLLEGNLIHFERQRDKVKKEIESLEYQMSGKNEQLIYLDASVNDIKEALELLKK